VQPVPCTDIAAANNPRRFALPAGWHRACVDDMATGEGPTPDSGGRHHEQTDHTEPSGGAAADREPPMVFVAATLVRAIEQQ
jgi:hypothetical protein